MNVKHYNLLHFALVLLLIISPLRSALAMQLIQCEMENMADDTMAEMAASSHHGDMHSMHDSKLLSQAETSHQHHMMQSEPTQPGADQHQCCCCDDGGNCAGNCDLGVNVSLVIQAACYAPALIEVTQVPLFSTDIVLRELTPPSRPPAQLHS